MKRLTERLRDFVGKGNATEAVGSLEKAPIVPPLPPAPAPVSAPTTVSPMGASVTVEAAYSMLHAFPKDTDDAQRFPALRSALSATLEHKSQTLQQLLAEVLQEKARIASVLQNQNMNFDLQQAKITEAVDALWGKREKLTEHHQRITLQGTERIEGLDQLIQCLSLTDEATQEPLPQTSVVVRTSMMELRPLGESPQAAEETVVEKSANVSVTEKSAAATEPRPNNPRKLYSRPAA